MNADKIFVSKIADIDSGIALMLSIMSFGLQQVATRDIAIKDNWKNILIATQKSRLSMGFFLLVIGCTLLLITNQSYYYIFMMAPIIALNIDYALYGRGLSVEASFLSLIKVGIPATILIVLGYFQDFNFNIYFLAVIAAWLTIGFFSNRLVNVFMLVKPTIHFAKVYVKNINIGFTDIVLTTLKLGILTLSNPFYDKTTIANAFVVLKLYVLVKGVQRIVFQAFYKDLLDVNKALLIDKIGLIIGVIFFSVTLLYPSELISALFSEDYLSTKHLLSMIGFATLVSSISISASPRMLIVNKDRLYVKSYFYAFIGTLLFLFLVSKTSYFFYGIIGAILFGESILNAFFFFFLKKDIWTKARFIFLGEMAVLIIFFMLNSIVFETSLSIPLNTVASLFYVSYFVYKNRKQIS